MTKSEYSSLLKNRPLIKYRPLKNSFTKHGDKKLLAESLEIKEPDVNKYIDNIINTNFEIQDGISKDNIEKVKTYVYRHGRKDQAIEYLKYELSDVKTTLKRLYKTLEDNSGGICDYFARPIHLLDNGTLKKMHIVINGSLNSAQNAGTITVPQSVEASEWALKRIYEIQSNQKIIGAAKIIYNNS